VGAAAKTPGLANAASSVVALFILINGGNRQRCSAMQLRPTDRLPGEQLLSCSAPPIYRWFHFAAHERPVVVEMVSC
jgi:hypothetical protein